MRARVLAVAVSIVLVVTGSSSCGAKPAASPVKIGYQKLSIYQHVFAAVEGGLFERHGVKAELVAFPSANRLMEALQAGQIQVAGLTNVQVAAAAETRAPGRLVLANALVWGVDTYPDYILAVAGSGIREPPDLNGKVVGLHPGSAVRAFSRVSLEKLGVNVSTVTFVELEPGVMAGAAAAKRVDALYCMEPIATQLVEAGAASVLTPNPMRLIFGPPTPISGTALSQAFIDQDHGTASAVVAAIDAAILSLRSMSREGAAAMISKYTGASADFEAKVNRSEYWTSSELQPEAIATLVQRFYELEILKDTPRPSLRTWPGGR